MLIGAEAAVNAILKEIEESRYGGSIGSELCRQIVPT